MAAPAATNVKLAASLTAEVVAAGAAREANPRAATRATRATRELNMILEFWWISYQVNKKTVL